MVILVVFNSFKVVQNLKKPDPVARQMPPFNTTDDIFVLFKKMRHLPLLANSMNSKQRNIFELEDNDNFCF